MTARAREDGASETAGRSEVARRGWRHGAGVLALAGLAAAASCLVALALTGGLPTAVPVGLPDAGRLTWWGLRVVTVGARLAAVCTVGLLLVGAVLLPAQPDGGLGVTARRALVCAGRWAACWAIVSGLELVLTSSDIAGVPVTGLDAETVAVTARSGPGAALCLVATLAAVVGVSAGAARTARAGRVLLACALAGLLPGVLSGHASSAAGHDVAQSALVVHVVAVSLWTGGLAGLVLLLRTSPTALAAAVVRFSPLALAAYVAVAGSGVLAASVRLDTSLTAWTSPYGALVGAKVAVLAVLGLVGHLHRRRTIPALAGRPGPAPFLRLAGVELVLMGVAMGLASALSRTAPPPVPEAAPSAHGTGHSSLPAVVERWSLSELATAWRLDAIVLVVLAAAVAGYARGVRAVRRQGGQWPALRTVAFSCGIAVALVDLCSGVATYAPAVLSVQVSQLLVALLVVPTLLLLGAPTTLWSRAGGRAPRLAASPITGAVAGSGLLLVVYRTPLIEASQRSYWLHLLVLLLAIVAGLLLLRPALDADDGHSPDGADELQWCLVAVAGCLAWLAAQLRYGDRLLAADWFLELRWGWVDPVDDQRLAGAVVAGAACAVLVLAVALPARRRAGQSLTR
ncbi:cytochrome c oxidase assembly protein [Nocardioides sp. P5_C9_2]